jgi:hypothetical protein
MASTSGSSAASSTSASTVVECLGSPLPVSQQRLDGDEEVVGLVDLDLEVGVARDPEGVVLDDLHPREHRVEIRGDHMLDRDIHRASREL